jgi:hypothetical protein
MEPWDVCAVGPGPGASETPEAPAPEGRSQVCGAGAEGEKPLPGELALPPSSRAVATAPWSEKDTREFDISPGRRTMQ